MGLYHIIYKRIPWRPEKNMENAKQHLLLNRGSVSFSLGRSARNNISNTAGFLSLRDKIYVFSVEMVLMVADCTGLGTRTEP